jgi:hypothetical protein
MTEEARPRSAKPLARSAIADLSKLADIHSDTIAPESVVKWLQTLRILGGVPFDYLVPDERMLPCESLRFFQVDPNWIYSLIEGAYSVARPTESDLKHDTVNASRLHAAVHNVPERKPPPQISGFLLRSAVVSGWPGLQVKVCDEKGNPLPRVLRFERITPDILLYLVEGIIHSLTFQEPSEGIHFGLDRDESTGHLMPAKSLRYVKVIGNTPKPGTRVVPDTPVTLSWRPKRKVKVDAQEVEIDDRVLNIASLARTMAKALQKVPGNDNAAPFTPAEFALEMIEGVEGVTITIPK